MSSLLTQVAIDKEDKRSRIGVSASPLELALKLLAVDDELQDAFFLLFSLFFFLLGKLYSFLP